MDSGNFISNESTRLHFPLSFEAERVFDVNGFKNWIESSSHYSLYFTAVYLFLTHQGLRYMKRKQAYNVKGFLVAWNVSLALMSIWGASRTVPELLYVIKHDGYASSLCENKNYELNPETMCALYVFCISKVVELFDTVFLILRKSQLVLFHRIQQSIVLIHTWYFIRDGVAMGRWLASINFTVHSFMYTYYALRVIGVHIPKERSALLTSAQVIKTIVLFGINLIVFGMWLSGRECAVSGRVLAMGMTLYSMYFFSLALLLYLIRTLPDAYKEKHVMSVNSEYLLDDRFSLKRSKLD